MIKYLFGEEIIMHVLTVIAVIVYILINCITSRIYNAREMHREFIEGQCLVGMICANIFYAPAWFLKGLRAFVVATIK